MAVSSLIKKAMEESSWIRKMFEEGIRLKKELGEENVFDLSLGNPTFEPPDEFRRNLLQLLKTPQPGMHRYMPNAGYPFVREKIAEFYREKTSLPFEGKHIIMTCGAAGALNVILKTLLDPKDEVIIFAPYFVEYLFYIKNHGGEPVVVRTNNDFSLNMVRVEEALTERTKAVLINSPNNPTGVLYGRYHLQSLGELLSDYGKRTGRVVYLINDAPYRKIVYDGREAPFTFDFYENSIEVTSHSKDLAIPGERIGHIAVCPNAEGVDDIMNGATFCNRTLGFVNAPALMQRAVADLQFLSVDISEYQKRRDFLFEKLSEIGYEMVKPEGAFYIFPRSPDEDDVAFTRRLQKRGVLVTPGVGFGAKGHFRISYCVPFEVIERSIPIFDEVARQYGL